MENEQVTPTDTAETTTGQAPAQPGNDAGQPTPEEEDQRQEQERQEQEAIEQRPWYRKRFDELTRKRYEEQRRAEEAQRRADEAEAKLREIEDQKRAKEQPFTPTRPRPTKDEFDYDEDKYFEALADWKFEQNQAKAENERLLRDAQNQHRTTQMTLAQKHAAIAQAGISKYSDWVDVVNAVPIPQEAVSITLDMARGAEVAYYLGKNPQEINRLEKLSPYAMAAELGKIEAKLSEVKPRTTAAPNPINPIKGGVAPPPEIDPDKDPVGWIAARNAGKI